MGRGLVLLLVAVSAWLLLAPLAMAGGGETSADPAINDEWVGEELAQMPAAGIADPIEPVNRFFFAFNDRFYFWVLKPVATGYKTVFSDPDVRGCFSNAFHNLLSPARIVNNLLQGKFKGAGTEFAALLINSTMGIAGFADPARREFGLSESDEDLGQTLGTYGFGNGFYICWPILGPSSLRDSVGRVGDAFLDPLTYLTASEFATGLAVHSGKEVNEVSFEIGEYEQLKEASFDPYVAVRDAYAQSRKAKVEDRAALTGGKRVAATPAPEVAIVAAPAVAGQEGEEAEAVPVSWSEDQVGGPDKGFFVRVGVYVDPQNVECQRQRLARSGRHSVVARYFRDNYSLYGVEVPAGADFRQAKLTEEELERAGFDETVVVRH